MKWLAAFLALTSQAAAMPARIQPPAFAGAAQQAAPKPPDNQDPENYLRPSEPLPPLKLAYFTGTWKIDWDVPETILGPGGKITGTETYAATPDGRFIESNVDATGPGGAFKQHALIAYNEAARVVSRYEKDSRGFETLSLGRIFTDQGFYLINFDGSSFTYQGQTLRFRTSASLMGPVAYRLRVQLSIDGGPFRSYGNAWWRKDAAANAPKPQPAP